MATAELWRMRLGSALRAASACSFVAGLTLFGPAPVRRLVAYPAFSYVTAILIVLADDVAMGDAVRGAWRVAGAVVAVLITAVPCLWAVGPGRFRSWSAAVAVAVSGFVVGVPGGVELMTKRIAFGEVVIVYVGTVINGGENGFFMHPVQVVSSAAIGAFASILAMLLPFPRFSSTQVRKMSQLYSKNASERLDLLVEGFGAKTKQEALASISQAKPLSRTASKLLHIIKRNLRGMDWERPRIGVARPNYKGIAEKLQEFEVAMSGMESALTSPAFAFGAMNEELCNLMNDLKAKAILKLEQIMCSVPPSATAPETKDGISNTSPPKLSSISHENLPVSFFLRCMELLLHDSIAGEYIQKTEREESIDFQIQETVNSKGTRWGILSNMLPTRQSFYFALRCSLTLGLAVFLGLTYSKQNGYWSGLTVAISFATERQAIFTVANARGQGTAMGSFYGVICCFILRKYEFLWILPLLPWVIFSSFLVHSRMYGESGAISAAIGALLILGRKNYGRPSDFANARIAEVCIGLLCFLTVEVIFNPRRAATLAKAEFSKCLGGLQDCFKMVILIPKKNLHDSSFYMPLREQNLNLKSCVNHLEKFIAEAKLEPNFWFTPFQGACYDKLLKSLLKMVDILQFLVHEMEFLSLKSHRSGLVGKELYDRLSEDMEVFNQKVGSSMKFLEKMTQIKSLKELQSKNEDMCEMEMGKSGNGGCKALALSEEDPEKIVSSFCQTANEVVSRVYREEGEADLKGQMILCLGSIGFCMKGLMRETMELEKVVVELLKLENPSIHLNLQEISLKINAHSTE